MTPFLERIRFSAWDEVLRPCLYSPSKKWREKKKNNKRGQNHLAVWSLHSVNPYNNRIHQASCNPVTFAELIHCLLFSLSLAASQALFQTKGFQQLRVSWHYANNHSHVYRFSRIRESTSHFFPSQQNHHCNNASTGTVPPVPLAFRSLNTNGSVN